MKKLLTALGITLFSLTTPAYGAVMQTSPVFEFENGSAGVQIEDGFATLNRTDDGLEFTIDSAVKRVVLIIQV